jgi:hypothetical protein
MIYDSESVRRFVFPVEKYEPTGELLVDGLAMATTMLSGLGSAFSFMVFDLVVFVLGIVYGIPALLGGVMFLIFKRQWRFRFLLFPACFGFLFFPIGVVLSIVTFKVYRQEQRLKKGTSPKRLMSIVLFVLAAFEVLIGIGIILFFARDFWMPILID